MIDAGKNVLLMHESSGEGGPDWYQSAYAITQEIPCLSSTVAAVSSRESCIPNRGPADGKLLLLNHWLDKQPVRTSQPEQVTTSDVPLARARLCHSERGLLPNLVAVNFVEIGATAEVVDELKGLPSQLTPPGG